jgi:hypothetical protein
MQGLLNKQRITWTADWEDLGIDPKVPETHAMGSDKEAAGGATSLLNCLNQPAAKQGLKDRMSFQAFQDPQRCKTSGVFRALGTIWTNPLSLSELTTVVTFSSIDRMPQVGSSC